MLANYAKNGACHSKAKTMNDLAEPNSQSQITRQKRGQSTSTTTDLKGVIGIVHTLVILLGGRPALVSGRGHFGCTARGTGGRGAIIFGAHDFHDVGLGAATVVVLAELSVNENLESREAADSEFILQRTVFGVGGIHFGQQHTVV